MVKDARHSARSGSGEAARDVVRDVGGEDLFEAERERAG